MDALNPSIQSAATLAYRDIERQIVTLELKPGSVITESALIERTGLGRTPVREAIQRLSWEGLAEIRPRSGIVIAPIDPADWIRALDVRREVEPMLASSAAELGSSPALEMMALAGRAMKEAVAAGNVLAFLEADKDFDIGLGRACDNHYAVRLAQPLQSHSRRFWYRFRGEDGLEPSANYHIGVIDAINERNATEAADRARAMVELLSGYARELV